MNKCWDAACCSLPVMKKNMSQATRQDVLWRALGSPSIWQCTGAQGLLQWTTPFLTFAVNNNSPTYEAKLKRQTMFQAEYTSHMQSAYFGPAAIPNAGLPQIGLVKRLQN